MSITTELREFVDGLACHKSTRDLLREIADRIDQEHEECAGFCRRLEDAASKGEEVTIFGTDYIPLPKDAEGETIRIGDKLNGYNKTIEVVELRYGRSGCVLVSRDGNSYHDTFAFEHIPSDTWMSILANAYNGEFRSFDELVERCKRLAGEDA